MNTPPLKIAVTLKNASDYQPGPLVD